MNLNTLHFAHPAWLWAAIAIPLVCMIYSFFFQAKHSQQLEKFIDKHLLKYLLINKSDKKSSGWKGMLLWSFVWACLTLALAGPRWDFRDIEAFSRDQSLVILLDLSKSMNATDIKPSRLIRAKQKIEDLINISKDVKIGLIAFAADPHMIAPITQDKESIRHLLPSLATDVIYVQGSRLGSALKMASNMLNAESGDNKVILVISDGGFEDSSAIIEAKKLAEKGLIIHTLGIGTAEGAPLQDHEGNVVKKNGAPIISKLEKERLIEMSNMGNGYYLEGNQDEAVVIKDMEKRANILADKGVKNRLWIEHFYVLIFPTLPIILWWFRRGAVIAV